VASLLVLAFAQAQAADKMSREQAVAYALAHHPAVRAARAGVEGALAREQVARAASAPTVDLAFEGRASDDPLIAFSDRLHTRSVTADDFDPARLNDPASSELFSTRLALSWPVYTGGRTEAELRRAGSERAAVESGGARSDERVAYEATVAWTRAGASAQALQIAAQARDAARRHARTTARLVREGRIVESDQLTAEVYLAGMSDAYEQARTRHAIALTRFAAAIGMDEGAGTEPDAWKEPPAGDAAPDLAGLERTALSRRADLKAMDARLNAAAAGVDSARARYRPQVRLGASSNWYDDSPTLDHQAWVVSGAVTMNLYSGGMKDAEIGAARGEHDRLQAERAALALRISREVREAWQARAGAAERVRLMRAHLARARRTVDLVAERYGQGRTLLIDLLQAERALADTRMAHLTAALDLRLADAAIAYATGSPAQ